MVSITLPADPALDSALARAAALDFGEAILIPAATPQDADRMRQYFYRQRKQKINEAKKDASIDSETADPWRGLVAEVLAFMTGEGQLRIRRPPELKRVGIVRKDGSVEEENL